MPKPPVLILAAGANSRMFPLNQGQHKGLVTLLGTPLINRTLENLAEHGFEKAIIVISPSDTQPGGLEEWLKENPPKIEYSLVVQEKPKGMGDAVLAAKDQLEDQFLVIAPYHHQSGAILNQLLEQEKEAVVYTATTSQPHHYGIVSLEGDRATGIVEKPEPGTEPSDQKVQVTYLLNTRFIEILAELPTETYNFEKALNQLMQESEVGVVKAPEALPSLKFPWHLFDIQNSLFKKTQSHTAPTASVAKTALLDDSSGPIIIDENATIGDFVKLVGPCYVGKNALVGDYSFVRSSSIEAEAQVGARTEVVRSIILRKVSIHASYLADSIVAFGAKIGAGFISANKRFDREAVTTYVKGTKTSTTRKSFGTVIGREATIGTSVNTMPGTLIGARTTIFPHIKVAKNIAHDQVLKGPHD